MKFIAANGRERWDCSFAFGLFSEGRRGGRADEIFKSVYERVGASLLRRQFAEGRNKMHGFDHWRNEQFQQDVRSDLDMLLLEKMYENTRHDGRSGRGYSEPDTSGWKNRGLLFWMVLVISVYWFILRPLGL